MHRRPTNTISVNHDLVRQPLVLFVVVSQSFLHKAFKDADSTINDLVFLGVFSGLVFALANDLFVQLLVLHFREVLGEGWSVGCRKSNNRVTASMTDINSNDHGIAKVFWDGDSVEVLLKLGIHLLQQIGINRNGFSDCW